MTCFMDSMLVRLLAAPPNACDAHCRFCLLPRYVVDATLNRVQKFDSSGTWQWASGASGSGDGQVRRPCVTFPACHISSVRLSAPPTTAAAPRNTSLPALVAEAGAWPHGNSQDCHAT